MGKASPKPPDYQGAAQQTADANMTNNRPNTASPFATQTTNPDGSISSQFSGPMAGVASSLQGQLLGSMGQGLDLSSLGAMPDGSAAREQAIQAAYSQAASRLEPQFQQREDALRTRLLNQGLDPNSEASQNEMGRFENARNDAFTSAMNSAIGQGTAASQAMFGQQMASRNQMLSELLRQRQQPMSDLQGLFGFLQQPDFNQVQGADFLSAAAMQGNHDLQTWEGRQRFLAELLRGGMDLGGSIAGAVAG